jgi:hypothetical protein
MPWVAPEWGVFLCRYRVARHSAFREVAMYRKMATRSLQTYRYVNKACGTYSLIYKI